MFRPVMLGVAILLAGCGSKSTGIASSTDRATRAANLADTLAQENLSTPDTLPMRGTATYAGFMTVALPIAGATTTYIGDLAIAIDFGAKNNQITGSAYNFDGLSGSLTIANGNLDRDTKPDVDHTFDGRVTGALENNGDSYKIDANLAGDFRGRKQDGLTGVIFGDIAGPTGQDIFQASIAASKND